MRGCWVVGRRKLTNGGRKKRSSAEVTRGSEKMPEWLIRQQEIGQKCIVYLRAHLTRTNQSHVASGSFSPVHSEIDWWSWQRTQLALPVLSCWVNVSPVSSMCAACLGKTNEVIIKKYFVTDLWSGVDTGTHPLIVFFNYLGLQYLLRSWKLHY